MISEIDIQKRKINIASAALLGFFFILIFILPTTSADDFINNMADTILKGGMQVIWDTLNKKGVFGKMFEFVTGDVNQLVQTNVLSNIKIIALIFVLGITFIHYFEAIDRGQDPVECTFKILVEFCISTFFLINAEKIMAFIAKLGILLISLISVNAAEADNTAQREALLIAVSGKTDGGMFWFVQCFAILSIPWLMSLLINIAAKFVIIQLLLELAIRRAFASLAITDIYKEGLRSPGMRYMKKYLAAFIKLMICAFIATLLPNILIAASGDSFDSVAKAFDYVFSLIAINFAAIGGMLKAGDVANDIIGA